MRSAQRRQPPGRLVDRPPGPDRRHRRRQPAAGGLGEMRRTGGHHADPEPRREGGQCRVALVVEGMAVTGQLDTDPVAAEALHQIGQGVGRRLRPAVGKRLAHVPLAAAGENVPVPAGRLGESVVVVARLALLAPGQVRGGQLAGEPPIALRPARQHQQVRPGRVGRLGAGDPGQGQLRAEDGAHAQFLGRLGEPHHPVEPVVVGQRDRAQIQPGGLLDEFLGRARTVEEAERRVRVQLGVGNRGLPGVPAPPGRRAVGPAFPRPGRAVAAVGGRSGERTRNRRSAVEHPLHLGPVRRPVIPAHPGTL